MATTRNRTRRRLARLDDQTLGRMIQHGGDEALAARDVLVERHQGLVKHLARRWSRDDDDLDDLEQEGLVGLMKAIERWDPEKGVPLGAWARQRIIQGLNRSAPHLPRHQVRHPEAWWTERLAAKRCERELGQALGRHPSPKETAAELGWSVEVVEDRLTAIESTPIEVLVQTPADVTVDIEAATARSVDSAEVLAVLARLPTAEREAFSWLARGYSRHEASRQMGVGYDQVTLLQQRAAAMLQHPRFQPPPRIEHQVAA